jgi:hypothetical protein
MMMALWRVRDAVACVDADIAVFHRLAHLIQPVLSRVGHARLALRVLLATTFGCTVTAGEMKIDRECFICHERPGIQLKSAVRGSTQDAIDASLKASCLLPKIL